MWSSRAQVLATLVLVGCGGLSVYTRRDDASTCDPATAECGETDADTDADSDSDTPPSADEVCGDGDDNDGNGLEDCEDPVCLPSCDEDQDGSFADADCDDGEPAAFPGAPEICDAIDNDCDGDEDEDEDGDGALVCDDCDDADNRRYPGAQEQCDGVDSDCDNEDLPRWTDDFEAGPPLLPEYGGSGDAPWGVDTFAPHLGAYEGGSGNIADNQNSALSLAVSLCADGSISFWHAGSSEAGWDYLTFRIDAVEAQAWSGTVAWTQETYNLPAGNHVLYWVYSKDVNTSVGQDTVWVDDLELLGGSP
jgi:hypothetical protein